MWSSRPSRRFTWGHKRTSLLWRRRTRKDHAALQPIQRFLRQNCSPSGRWRLVENPESRIPPRSCRTQNLSKMRLHPKRESCYARVRGLTNATLLLCIPRSKKKKHSSNAAICHNHPQCLAVYLSGAVLYMHCVRAVMRQSHKTGALERLECALLPGWRRLPHPGRGPHSQMRFPFLVPDQLDVTASLAEQGLLRSRTRRLRCPHQRWAL